MTEPNWKNRTLWTGDNLDIMRGMNSESVDLIYLDPPFNSKKNYEAPIGSEAAGAAFKDNWTLGDVDRAWHGEIADRNHKLYEVIKAAQCSHSNGMMSYLIMMAPRLMEMRRILKDTGSIYLHCDPTASHYLKVLMDAIFVHDNFRNEIIWAYQRWTAGKRRFQRMHDTILFYGRDDKKTVFNPLMEPYSKKSKHRGPRSTAINKDGIYEQTYTGDTKREKVMRDVWEMSYLNSQAKERVGYPTQKPLALLDRIIKASSNEGDIVFDPFAGCATACVAADRLQRDWIGIDLSPLAASLVKTRLEKDTGLFFEIHHRNDIPKRSDQGDIPNYKTHKHTLFGDQEGICNGCQIFFPFRNFTTDHIVPQAKGGSDHIDNLQLLCGACNSKKGTRSQAEFIAILIEEGIRK